jgi:T5SS/PEP-CTERM-associated repeat protein
MRYKLSRSAQLTLSAATVAFAAHTSFGQTSTWLNDATGSYNLAANWSSSVPGTNGTAIFTASGSSYDVDFTTNRATGAVRIEKGSPTLDLGTRTLTLTDTADSLVVGTAVNWGARLELNYGTVVAPKVVLGRGATSNLYVSVGSTLVSDAGMSIGETSYGALSVDSGGIVNTSHISMGLTAGVTGSVHVNGPSSKLNSNSILSIGDKGTGSLLINNGGDAHSLYATIGYTGTSHGVATVSGSGSTWDVSNTISIGEYGDGILNITSGALVTSAFEGGLIGQNAGSSGDVYVAGSGATWNTTELCIGGDIDSAGGVGLVTVQTGGTINVSDTVRLWPNATVNLNGGTLSLKAIDLRGGKLKFNAGTVAFTGIPTLDAATLDAVLGAGTAILGGRTLSVAGTATLAAPITLNGGTLAVGNLAAGSNVVLHAGTLNLLVADLAIGTGGQLGSTVVVDDAAHVQLAMGANVQSAGLLRLAAGRLTAANTVTNHGEIEFAGSTARLTAPSVSNFGTLRGSGRIVATLDNAVGAQVQINAAQRLVVDGVTTNSGNIALIAGEAQFNGPLTNNATGVISNRDAVLSATSIANSGMLTFGIGTSDVHAPITQLSSGRINLSSGASANFYGDVVINAGAPSVQLSSSSALATFFGSYNGGSSGAGQVFIEGEHRPGNGPSVVTFGGPLSYGGGSRLVVELGGLTRGTQYDGVNTVGGASLDGIIRFTRVNGFQPLPGDQFDLIHAMSVSGSPSFELDLGGYVGLSVVPITTANSFSVLIAGLPGDADLDADVDFQDLVALAQHYDQPNSDWFDGDFDRNGTVAFNDLVALAQHYGQSASGAIVADPDRFEADFVLAQSLVPEPSAIASVAALAGVLIRRRRRVK